MPGTISCSDGPLRAREVFPAPALARRRAVRSGKRSFPLLPPACFITANPSQKINRDKRRGMPIHFQAVLIFTWDVQIAPTNNSENNIFLRSFPAQQLLWQTPFSAVLSLWFGFCSSLWQITNRKRYVGTSVQ